MQNTSLSDLDFPLRPQKCEKTKFVAPVVSNNSQSILTEIGLLSILIEFGMLSRLFGLTRLKHMICCLFNIKKRGYLNYVHKTNKLSHVFKHLLTKFFQNWRDDIHH